ncbi:MAG: family 10 glycosylhydrolase [bacterium]|nr:family 10 glycosylhydrolase [bacterium]
MKRYMFHLVTGLILLLSLWNCGFGKDIPIETRGVWVDKSDVYKGKDYLISMFDNLTAANFNTVYLPVLYRGYVIYPNSKYLPQDPKAIEIDKDILRWMIEQAHRRRLLVESWPEFGFYAYWTKNAANDPSRGVILDKHPDLTAIDITGLPYLHNKDWGDFYSLCPSNPRSQRIMIELLCEPIQRYEFDGLNLDRIRYPTKDFCFCAYCKKQFRKETGINLTKESLENEETLRTFYTWRKEQLNKFMQNLSNKIRKMKPAILITADVWTPNEINPKGQDWGTWLKKGYIDIAIPMMYWSDIESELNASLQLSANPRRILAGISAETNSSEQLANQIELARNKNCGGVVIWYLGKLEDNLAYLKTTVFHEPSQPFIPKND